MTDRRMLAAVAVAAGVKACVLAGTAGDRVSSLSITLMLASFPLSVAAVLRPDTHIGLGVVVVTAWCWLRATPDDVGPRVLAIAVALLVFHATVALMATTPPSATPHLPTLRRWSVNTAAAGVATAMMWLLVVAVRGHRGGASAASLSVAVLGVAVAAMWVRGHTLSGGVAGAAAPLRQFRRRSSGAREIPLEPGGQP